MALIEMKVKVYRPDSNYRNLSIMTETQKEEYLKEQEQVNYEDERELSIWLEENYNLLGIFKMSEEELHQIDKEWRESCRQYVEDCFKEDYTEDVIILKVEEEELNSHTNFRLIGID